MAGSQDWTRLSSASRARRANSGRRKNRVRVWIRAALSVPLTDCHRGFLGDVLRAISGPRPHHGRVHHKRSDRRLVLAEHSRLWIERNHHRAAASSHADFCLWVLQSHRELVWLAGCVLLALMLGMAFTGYLLPWDQKAYFATTVGTNILSEVPWVGNAIKKLLRGGTEMGTLTLSRFFVLHVFMIPAFIFAFVALHVFLFRRAGAAGPIQGEPEELKQATETFYPKQVIFDIVFALLIIAGLGLLAHYAPVELGPKANPADTQYVPRPEWYYIPVFQWLKYWESGFAVVGILVIPAFIALLFVGLPFLDRRPERRPWKRPVAVSIYAFIFIALGALGAISHRHDLRDSS